MLIPKLKSLIRFVGKTSWRVARALDREFNAPDSKWVRDTGSTKVIVFVHGLLSESPKAWRGGETTWPKLMLDDSDYDGWDIIEANWYSTVMSEERTIEIEAQQLCQDLFGHEPPFEEVVFICHSLGGIVVRQMLMTHPVLIERYKINCITLGTPAKGAKLATVLSSISKFFKHSQAQALVFNSPTLQRIHEGFFKLVQESGDRIAGREFYESEGLGRKLRLAKMAGKYGLRVPPLVGLESQGGYFGNPTQVPDTDHASISRPESSDAQPYLLVKEFLEESFDEPS
jgi:triacylglycerol esterase/lipase EstA (alpha/beta hydrolase family)